MRSGTDALTSSSEESSSAISPRNAALLKRFGDRFEGLLTADAYDILTDYIDATESSDARSLGQSLWFVLEFEWLLREHMGFALRSELGTNWLEKLAEEVDSWDRARPSSGIIATWTLSDLAGAVPRLKASGFLPERFLEIEGIDSRILLPEIVRLRNEVAHGRTAYEGALERYGAISENAELVANTLRLYDAMASSG